MRHAMLTEVAELQSNGIHSERKVLCGNALESQPSPASTPRVEAGEASRFTSRTRIATEQTKTIKVAIAP